MKRKIALIGSNGQLGTDIMKIASKEEGFIFFPLTHNDIDISNKENVFQILSRINPDIILNTAAYNRVEDAENNIQEAFSTNTFAVKYLADFAKQNDCILTHISSDYVFGLDSERRKPYSETDAPGPMNIYGLSKLAGEYLIQQHCSKYFIIRSSALFGIAQSSSKGYNLVELMLKFAKEKKEIRVVDDQITSPTYTLDLAKQIMIVMKQAPFGMYHSPAQGHCTHYEFAKEIFRLTKLSANLKPITSEEFGSIAKRPHYSVLATDKLKKLKLYTMRDWHEGLEDYLKEKDYI